MKLEFSAKELEEGRLLFARGTNFIKSVLNTKNLPIMDRNEVAFAGRSNVGKSSLINALTNIHKLARTSNTPGRTQELNYFDVNATMYLVDMPGYGYAKASKDAIQKWNILIKKYLQGRANLRRVYILVDSRHGLKPKDIELMSMLDEYAVSYAIVLTKSDKISQKMLLNISENVQKSIEKRAASYPFVIETSSEKKKGIDMLRTCILQAINC